MGNVEGNHFPLHYLEKDELLWKVVIENLYYSSDSKEAVVHFYIIMNYSE